MIVIIRGNQIYIKYIILLFPFYQQLKQYQVLYGKQNISLLFQYIIIARNYFDMNSYSIYVVVFSKL